MASAWGQSWGLAFGAAWGRVVVIYPTAPIPANYKTIATQIFSGQITGAHNALYARIARRR